MIKPRKYNRETRKLIHDNYNKLVESDKVTYFRIELPYACYGLCVKNGRVVMTAPIAGWMVGKEWNYCYGWLSRKGADISMLDF